MFRQRRGLVSLSVLAWQINARTCSCRGPCFLYNVTVAWQVPFDTPACFPVLLRVATSLKQAHSFSNRLQRLFVRDDQLNVYVSAVRA